MTTRAASPFQPDARTRLASGKPPLLLFATSHVYGRRRSGDEVIDLSHALARVLIEEIGRAHV